MKRSFFQAAIVSILLYGCTTLTLTKRLEKKLDGNYTRMLRAILNRSWRQHPTKQQLYGHLPPITKTIKVRRTRHAGHCWRSRDKLISDVLLWTPSHGWAKAEWPARTYIQQLCEDTGVAVRTCRKRWTIGRSGERGSGISMLMARHDDEMMMKYILQITFLNDPELFFFFLHTVKCFQVLLHNSHNLTSVICLRMVCSIWPIDKTGATTPNQSGSGSNGNEGVQHIPQIFNAGPSPSEGLMSYLGYSLAVGEVLPFCRNAVGVFYSPSRLR